MLAEKIENELVEQNGENKKVDFYHLKYDRVFKKVVDVNPEVLEKVLTDILEEEVKIISFVPTELPVKNVKSKVNTLDILVKTKDNQILNIELNTNFDKVTKERNLVYYTTLYSQKKLRGEYIEDIDEELEVLHIDINFNESKKEEEKKVYYVQNEKGERYSNSFKIITVNIAKYKHMWYDKNIKGDKTHIYLVMLDANKEELRKLAKVDKLVKGVDEEVEKLNSDEVFIKEISREEEMKIREQMRVKMAKKEGIEEGKTNKANAIAKNMLESGEREEKILKYTGLSKEELEKLK